MIHLQNAPKYMWSAWNYINPTFWTISELKSHFLAVEKILQWIITIIVMNNNCYNNFWISLSILVSRLSYDLLVQCIKVDQNILCVNLYSSKSTMLDPSMAKYIADRPNYSGRTALNKVLTQLENPNHNLLKWYSK